MLFDKLTKKDMNFDVFDFDTFIAGLNARESIECIEYSKVF